MRRNIKEIAIEAVCSAVGMATSLYCWATQPQENNASATVFNALVVSIFSLSLANSIKCIREIYRYDRIPLRPDLDHVHIVIERPNIRLSPMHPQPPINNIPWTNRANEYSLAPILPRGR